MQSAITSGLLLFTLTNNDNSRALVPLSKVIRQLARRHITWIYGRLAQRVLQDPNKEPTDLSRRTLTRIFSNGSFDQGG